MNARVAASFGVLCALAATIAAAVSAHDAWITTAKVKLLTSTPSTAIRVADAALKEKVETALKADAALEGVNVASVHKGVVLLSGRAASSEHELRAIQAARAVAGVQRVASRIQTESESR
jgi:osmotically-inducible protein OsmY